jgi:hypothetical protein
LKRLKLTLIDWSGQWINIKETDQLLVGES